MRLAHPSIERRRRGRARVVVPGLLTAAASVLLLGTPATWASTLPDPAPAATGTSSGSTSIVGYGGRCVDIRGGVRAERTRIQIYGCNGTAAQRWTVKHGRVHALGRCLAVARTAAGNGMPVQLRRCSTSPAQRWTLRADGSLRNRASGRCLDLPNSATKDGVGLAIWRCTGAANQRWTFNPPALPGTSSTPGTKPTSGTTATPTRSSSGVPAPSGSLPTPSASRTTTASPTPSATTPSSGTSASANDTFRAQILTATNQQRAANGVSSFSRTACLDDFAQKLAEHLAATQKLVHQDFGPILSTCGDNSAAENIAQSWTDATGASAVNQWMNSTGHRTNLLNPSYTDIGIGAARDAQGKWWSVQDFGGH